MLQQTTTPHATPYFHAFTRRWPTVRDLAAAEDAEVMAAWAGLGYYARARNLLAAARAVAGRGGTFPDTEEALRALPGFGAYTAASVAAIAFGRAANVVDGNVERVMARLYAVETPLPAAKPELRRLAGALVTDERPGDWAQALMDLGATVCRPKSPLCGRCPLADPCLGRAGGAPERFPVKGTKAPRPRRYGAAFVLTRGDAVALVTRPAKGLLGGMAGLPTTEWTVAPLAESEALTSAPSAATWRDAGEVEHVFTHFPLTLRVYAGEAEEPGGWRWTPRDEARAALPTVFRKALDAGLGRLI